MASRRFEPPYDVNELRSEEPRHDTENKATGSPL